MNRSLSLALALTLIGCGALVGCGAAPTAPAAPKSPEPTSPKASAGAAAKPASGAETQHVAKVDVAPAIKAVLDAPDREADDKELDAGRHAAELLTFMGIHPGMKVAELAAGVGYSAELLARAVGPTGVVYGQNNQWILDKFADKPWTARLAKPVNKNVVKVTRDFEDPLPPEAKDLDVVLCNLFYHDTFWANVDRAKMNASVLKALKPGGKYVIVDHSGRPGTGSTEVKTLHRVEEKVVLDEVLKAGFKLAQEADFMRNPADTRDWNAAPFAAGEKRGTSDRFVLVFVKP
jgi:predicted methyltransferase